MKPEHNTDWNIGNIPPPGHEDVAKYAWDLYESSRDERDRLQLPETWRANYKLYRGNHWGNKKKKNNLTINLFFANVQRTVANVTARNPVAECTDLDGNDDGLDKVVTAMLRKWWQDSSQKAKLRTTTQKAEKYGITIEKSYWDAKRKMPGVAVVDPFAFFPAPGHYEDIGTDCPYISHAYPEPVDGVEAMFDVEGVEPSEVYSTLGEDREDDRPVTSGTAFGSTYSRSNTGTSAVFPALNGVDIKERRALVVEVWVRDTSTDKEGCSCFRDGIRRITVTNEGNLLLADDPNPNINWELEPEKVEKSYLYGRLPFYKVNSYEDTTSIWGFSAADQVAELNIKIDEIFSRLVNYVMRSMTGVLIIPPKSGITRSMINNKPGLVLFPHTHEAAAGIRYLAPPSLPATFERTIDMLMGLYDRIYAIQDADRGNAPSGVIAASAIIALQERNAVLIQHKINNIDYMVEQRGRCAISMWQNHGHDIEFVEAEAEQVRLTGTSLAGRSFNYVVESGSTVPKTTLQVQEQAVSLYEQGAIDREALLENLNFPGWKQIIERVGEGQLEQAIQILVQAGLPEDQAMELKQYLMEPDQTEEDGQDVSQQPQPGMPKAEQGEMPNASI